MTWSTNNTDFLLTTPIPPADYVTGIMYFSFVMSAVLLTLGLFSNTTTIIVMRKPPFKSTAHSVYLSTLAFCDSLCLICLCLTKGSILFLFGIDLTAVNGVICKVVKFVFSTARLGSVSVIVLICIERFAGVWAPFKARVMLTRRTACVSVRCVSIVAVLICWLSVPFSGLVKGYCVVYNNDDGFLGMVAQCASLVLNFYLPTLILLILTPLTVGKLCHARIQRAKIARKTNDATAKHAVMLISVVIEYFIVSVCCSVVYWTFFSSKYYRTLSQGQFMVVALECIMTVGQVNYSMNFSLYGLTSSEYRHSSMKMLMGLFRRA